MSWVIEWRKTQLGTSLRRNGPLFSGRSVSELGDYSGVISWFSVSQKLTRLRNKILKEPIRERFIERGDVEFCFLAEWSFRFYEYPS